MKTFKAKYGPEDEVIYKGEVYKVNRVVFIKDQHVYNLQTMSNEFSSKGISESNLSDAPLPEPKFKVGDRVTLKGNTSEVGQVLTVNGCGKSGVINYLINWGGVTEASYAEQSLVFAQYIVTFTALGHTKNIANSVPLSYKEAKILFKNQKGFSPKIMQLVEAIDD